MAPPDNGSTTSTHPHHLDGENEGIFTQAPTITRPTPPPSPPRPSSPPPPPPRPQRRGCCGLPPVRHMKHAPSFQHVPHIARGYRVGLNMRQCLVSLFTFHNESINIWSHLLGACYILYALQQFLKGQQWHKFPLDDKEYAAILTFLLCAVACLSFSTFYHLFGCHSEKMFNFLLRVDLIGISLLIWGSYVPGIHYAYACFPFWQNIYQYATIINLILGLIGAAFTDLNCPKESAFRTYTFAFLVAFGLVPSIHWCFLVPANVRGIFLFHLAGMFVCYTLGFVFWTTRFPECVWPKQCDLLLSSHQLWHICIFVAVFVWLNGIVEYHHALHDPTMGCALLTGGRV